MKTLLHMMAIVTITLSAEASSVVWDVVSKTESSFQQFEVLRNGDRPYFWSIFDFNVVVSGGQATLSSNPGGSRILSYAGAWLSAYCGDIVNAETTLHAGSYFEYGLLGNGAAAENPITVNIGTVNYLKIVLQDGEQCFDYQDGSRTVMPDCYYGWVAYSVDGNGTVTVHSSALDITGSSIVVCNAIPEPSSAMLLLIGGGILLLQRKRKFGGTLRVLGCRKNVRTQAIHRKGLAEVV